jgi:hypothetical protein
MKGHHGRPAVVAGVNIRQDLISYQNDGKTVPIAGKAERE